MTRKRFRLLVERAVKSLPEEVRRHLRDVEIVVQDRPPDELLLSLEMDPRNDTLFGFYEGTPITERMEHQDGSPIPVTDTIFIFQEPLEESFDTDEVLLEEIRATVIHEVGHHLGLDDDRIDELGFG